MTIPERQYYIVAIPNLIIAGVRHFLTFSMAPSIVNANSKYMFQNFKS
jgi:hypothetical protein